ncbi:MAG: NAD(P)H-binding protein [Woeseiaceae bacterium]
MRVAMIGGTGFVGSYIVDALIAAGHEPSLLVRAGSESKVRQKKQCRLFIGDVKSNDKIAAVIAGCDAVIFCIGILREYPRQGITYEEMQYQALVRVADQARAQGVTRFLLMSANGVRCPGTPYQETKYRAEQYLQSHPFEVTVFRPSVVFGDPQGRMEIATQLYRDMVRPPLPAIGFFTGWRPSRGPVMMSPVHVADVAAAFVSSLEKPATVGQTYELGGPDALSWTEMLRRIASATQKNKWIVPMPISMMYLAAMLLDWLPSFPVTRDQLTMLAEGNVTDSAAIRSLIGRLPESFTAENLLYLEKEAGI